MEKPRLLKFKCLHDALPIWNRKSYESIPDQLMPPSPSNGTARIHSPVRQKKPVGQPTRGKTGPNRLRRTDIFLALYDPIWMRTLPSPYLDLGYGASATTTLETFNRLQRINPHVRVLGVEIDPERVAVAQPFARPGLEFRLGGFNLPLGNGETVGIIRAMNVLRQYPEAEHSPAVRLLASYLMEGGLLLEGTSDPTGRLMVWNLFRRKFNEIKFEGLVFSVKFFKAFSPRTFQPVLPKNCIHHANPGSELDHFFQSWTQAWQQSIQTNITDPRVLFVNAALLLSNQYRYPIDLRPALLRRGFLRLRDIPGTNPPTS